MTDKMVEEESCLCISFQSLETSFSEASTQVEVLMKKASRIMKSFNGKKKLVRNFWKPYFNGEKLTKQQIKNIKRFIRRTLFQMFIKIDRHTIQNMSNSVFLDQVMRIQQNQQQEFIQRIADIEQIYKKIGLKCEKYAEWSENKKLFLVLELLEIQKQLAEKILQKKKESREEDMVFCQFDKGERVLENECLSYFKNITNTNYEQNLENNVREQRFLQPPILDKSEVGSNIQEYINIC